jgi:3-phytase
VNSNPRADNNYKLVAWADVVAGLGLTTGEPFDPRGSSAELAVAVDAVAVTASAETSPVLRNTDSADDPAVWLHPTDPAQSLIIGTDKRAGLVSYALTGEAVQVVEVGRVNNVDVRQNVTLGGDLYDVAVATNRTTSTLDLYTLDRQTGEIVPVAAFPSQVEEVYGVCLFAAKDGALYAFVNSADTGEVEQYALNVAAGVWSGEVVRTFVVGSQTEGCVVDDVRGVLYIGEEARGVWRTAADPTAPADLTLIDQTGEEGNLTADVEGVALFGDADGAQYLVVSSQGSSTFVVYDAQTDAYLGTVRVAEGETTDAVSGTDGIEVVSVALPGYPNGLLIVQDDVNLDGAVAVGQNFKLIDFGQVLAAIGR